ncbi:hypothetical protein [Methanobacterium sp. MBAC-LM]
MTVKYLEIYSPENPYWEIIEKEIVEFCRTEKLDYRIYFQHK